MLFYYLVLFAVLPLIALAVFGFLWARRRRTHKVERYSMGIAAPLVFGVASDFEVQQWCDIDFQPDRATTNVSCPGMVVNLEAQVDNVTVIGFSELIDAYVFSASRPSSDDKFKSPVMRHGMKMRGKYTGLVPDGYKAGQAFTFRLNFVGWSGITLVKIETERDRLILSP